MPSPFARAALRCFRGRSPTSASVVYSSFLLLVVRPGAPSSFLLLLVRHLFLVAMHLFLVAMPLLPTCIATGLRILQIAKVSDV